MTKSTQKSILTQCLNHFFQFFDQISKNCETQFQQNLQYSDDSCNNDNKGDLNALLIDFLNSYLNRKNIGTMAAQTRHNKLLTKMMKRYSELISTSKKIDKLLESNSASTDTSELKNINFSLEPDLKIHQKWADFESFMEKLIEDYKDNSKLIELEENNLASKKTEKDKEFECVTPKRISEASTLITPITRDFHFSSSVQKTRKIFDLFLTENTKNEDRWQEGTYNSYYNTQFDEIYSGKSSSETEKESVKNLPEIINYNLTATQFQPVDLGMTQVNGFNSHRMDSGIASARDFSATYGSLGRPKNSSSYDFVFSQSQIPTQIGTEALVEQTLSDSDSDEQDLFNDDRIKEYLEKTTRYVRKLNESNSQGSVYNIPDSTSKEGFSVSAKTYQWGVFETIVRLLRLESLDKRKAEEIQKGTNELESPFLEQNLTNVYLLLSRSVLINFGQFLMILGYPVEEESLRLKNNRQKSELRKYKKKIQALINRIEMLSEQFLKIISVARSCAQQISYYFCIDNENENDNEPTNTVNRIPPITRRAIYYQEPETLWQNNQSNFDNELKKFCSVLNFSPDLLNILPNPVAKFFINETQKCYNLNPQPKIMEREIEEVFEDLEALPSALLVVEKETVFTHLQNIPEICSNFILLTSNGFPTFVARRFLLFMILKKHFPIYFLTDCDPSGINILRSYIYGKKSNDNTDNKYNDFKLPTYACQWLGLRATKLQRFQSFDDRILEMCQVKSTKLDKSKARNLLKDKEFLVDFPNLLPELEFLIDNPVKYELEVFSKFEKKFVVQHLKYLLGKVLMRDFMVRCGDHSVVPTGDVSDQILGAQQVKKISAKLKKKIIPNLPKIKTSKAKSKHYVKITKKPKRTVGSPKKSPKPVDKTTQNLKKSTRYVRVIRRERANCRYKLRRERSVRTYSPVVEEREVESARNKCAVDSEDGGERDKLCEKWGLCRIIYPEKLKMKNPEDCPEKYFF